VFDISLFLIKQSRLSFNASVTVLLRAFSMMELQKIELPLERFGNVMENLTYSHIALDTWMAARGGISAVRVRQQRRLNELVEFVRENSRYYAAKYSHLPDQITDVRQLPG